jgi:hypothetical protein
MHNPYYIAESILISKRMFFPIAHFHGKQAFLGPPIAINLSASLSFLVTEANLALEVLLSFI